jgi:hypothetical protein
MLEHSIFQTEVQFNAPTPSNHPSGSDYQTSHPTGEPPLEWTGSGSRAQPSTQIIGKENDRIVVWPAQADGKPNRAYGAVWSSITTARNSIEDSGKHWIDKASGKVPKPKKKKSKRKRSWRSRLKALRRKYKW